MRIKIYQTENAKRILFKITFPLILGLLILNIYFLSAFAVSSVKTKQDISENLNKPTVIVDAGHGGFDGGAVVNNISEKNINLNIALSLTNMLKLSGINVINTRTEDVSTESDSSLSVSARKKSDMQNRLALTAEYKDAIFVSIHLNKFPSQNVRGAQIFYGVKNKGSENLALCIKNSIVSLLQKENTRPLKAGNKDMFLLYKSEIPSVIVECGFMSNYAELELLTDEKYQQNMAFAVFIGILEYLKQ